MANEKLIDTNLLSYFESKLQNKYATKTELADYLPLSGGTMTGIINTPTNTTAINLRPGHANYNATINYRTTGNEAVCFDVQNSVTSFIFRTRNSVSDTSSDWTQVTPSLQIKNQQVAINKLIANGASLDYNLDVNGSANATTLYQNGVQVATTNDIPTVPTNVSAFTNDAGYLTDVTLGTVVRSATLNGLGNTSPSWYAPTSAITTSTSKRYLLGSSSSTSIATTNTNASCYMQSGYLYSNSTKVDMAAKQDKLVSGTNIKTVNNNSLLGSGNISITASETVAKVTICSTETAVAITGGSAYLFLPYGLTGTFANSASGSSYTFYGPAVCIGGTVYYSNSNSRNFNTSVSVGLTPLYRFKGIVIKIV